jgi:two-component system cell cycle response regulator CtrA
VIDSGPFIRSLRDQIANLKEENAELRSLLATDDAHRYRLAFGLTGFQASLLSGFMRRPSLTIEQIMVILYPDGRRRSERSTKNASVQVWHLNQSLKRYGVRVEVVWGEGYRLPTKAKGKLTAAIGALKTPVEACETPGLPAYRRKAAE